MVGTKALLGTLKSGPKSTFGHVEIGQTRAGTLTAGRGAGCIAGQRLIKLAVITEGVDARYLGGQTVGEGYNRVGPAVALLVSRALQILGGDF